jgi:hypothetical protein
MVVDPVTEHGGFHGSIPRPRHRPDPFIQRAPSGWHRALRHHLTVGCLDTESDQLLVNVQSHKIGLHRNPERPPHLRIQTKGSGCVLLTNSPRRVMENHPRGADPGRRFCSRSPTEVRLAHVPGIGMRANARLWFSERRCSPGDTAMDAHYLAGTIGFLFRILSV